MKNERPYQFREFLNQVHRPNRRNPHAAPLQDDETMLDEAWSIVIPENAGIELKKAVLDFQDYLLVSMNLPVSIHTRESGKVIVLRHGNERNSRAFEYECDGRRVIISGDSWIGVQQGLFYLEDLMNLREQPCLKHTGKAIRRYPLFSPRMVHSGFGLDQYPDTQLSLIAHAGFDSIIIFVAGLDKTPDGPLDFNDVIRRAAGYGLDTYFYSRLNAYKHPDDEDAAAFFEAEFGTLFRNSPGAKGLILVGECCEFPTKDPRANSALTTSGVNPENDGICSHKSGSGWWPCSDYPQWLNAVKSAVRRHAPAAEIIFWTYNFGCAPEEAQKELLRNLPGDITLLITFEMYEQRRFPNHTARQADYSITFPGPSRIFEFQSECARQAGIPLYSMTNTGGRTWDTGVCPYVPVPQQWFKRYESMHQARAHWHLSGLMESHHYGWYPSVVSECSKWSFWSPQEKPDEILNRIALRDFGPGGAAAAVAAWRLWSEAIGEWSPSFGDQCGPLRAGAAYPLIFLPYLYPHVEQNMEYPGIAARAKGFIHPVYFPEHVYGGSACGKTIHEDLKILPAALARWREGEVLMEQAVAAAPPEKRANAEKILGVGKFFSAAVQTMINAKKWFILNRKLEIEPDFDTASHLLDDMLILIGEELANVRAVIPVAENDSILGWEPCMEYVGGPRHLHWKIRQLENLRDFTLPAYRRTLQVEPSLSTIHDSDQNDVLNSQISNLQTDFKHV